MGSVSKCWVFIRNHEEAVGIRGLWVLMWVVASRTI